MRHKFIAIEGVDGAGKTTQIKLLANYLKKRGEKVMCFSEPGGTPLGKKIRKLLLDKKNSDITPLAELFLFMASRAQLVEKEIIPALKKKAIIICDRYLFSSVAYQGWACGLGIENVLEMGKVAVNNLLPDITIIIDMDPQKAFKRGQQDDRIGGRGISFYEKVREGYLLIAKKEPKIKVINGTLSVDEVHKNVVRIVEDVIGTH